MGLYPLFHLGLKHFFLWHYDFFSFINFPNVLESAHKWVQIDNEIVLWSGLSNHILEKAFSQYKVSTKLLKLLRNCLEANARKFPIQSITNNVQMAYKLLII